MAGEGNIPRVTLISLPNPTMTDQRIAPPLGLLYIAAMIQTNDAAKSIEIIDLATLNDTSIDSCYRQLNGIDADIIGVSIASTQISYGSAVCRYLRAALPDAMIVVGGPHPTSLPEETLAGTKADVAVVGEGEMAMLDICRGESVMRVVQQPRVADLDRLPLPARHLLDFTQYTRTIGGAPATNMITTRGCPGCCAFCDQDMWHGPLRCHSADYVLAEIDDIYATTGIRRILFLDDTLTHDRSRMMAICDGLRDRGTVWRGWTRADKVDSELLAAMKLSGCHALCIGVESGSDEVLRRIHKGITSVQNLEAARMIREAGIYLRVSIIVGNPGETPETIEETKQFMLAAQPDDWIVSTFVPVVGSPAWRHPERYGFKLLHRNYEDYYVVGGEQQSGLVMELDTMSNNDLMKQRENLIAWLNINVPRKPELTVQ